MAQPEEDPKQWMWSVPLLRLRDSLDAVSNSLDDELPNSASGGLLNERLAMADADLMRVTGVGALGSDLQPLPQEPSTLFGMPVLPNAVFGVLIGVMAVVVAVTGFVASRFMPPFKRRRARQQQQQQQMKQFGGGYRHTHHHHRPHRGAIRDKQLLSRPIAGELADDNLINLSPLVPVDSSGGDKKMWHQVPIIGSLLNSQAADNVSQSEASTVDVESSQQPQKSSFFGSMLSGSSSTSNINKKDSAASMTAADSIRRGFGKVFGSQESESKSRQQNQTGDYWSSPDVAKELGSDDDDDWAAASSAATVNERPSSLGTINFQLGYSEKARALLVKIDSCEQLNFPNGSTRNMNPYVKVELIADEYNKHARTRLTRKTRSPAYNEEFTFYNLRAASLKNGNVIIRFVVQSADRHARSQPIGQLMYSMGDGVAKRLLESLAMNGNAYAVRESRQLEPCLDQANGNRPEVLLSLCWQNLGPAMRRLTVVALKLRNPTPVAGGGGGGGTSSDTTQQQQNNNNGGVYLRFTLGCIRLQAPEGASSSTSQLPARRNFERFAKKKTHVKVQQAAATASDSTAVLQLNFNESFIFDVSPTMLLHDSAASADVEQRMDAAALESLTLIVEAFEKSTTADSGNTGGFERCIGQAVLAGTETASSNAAVAEHWRNVIGNPRRQSAEWYALLQVEN